MENIFTEGFFLTTRIMVSIVDFQAHYGNSSEDLRLGTLTWQDRRT